MQTLRKITVTCWVLVCVLIVVAFLLNEQTTQPRLIKLAWYTQLASLFIGGAGLITFGLAWYKQNQADDQNELGWNTVLSGIRPAKGQKPHYVVRVMPLTSGFNLVLFDPTDDTICHSYCTTRPTGKQIHT